MWLPKHGVKKPAEGNGLVALAIDKDKGSQQALRWAADNLLSKGQTVILIHVVHKLSSNSSACNSFFLLSLSLSLYIYIYIYIIYILNKLF
jgi:hypothetical protein